MKLMMDTEGRPYGRKDVLDGLLQAGVPRDSIEALGVRERNVDWEVTLKSTAARNRIVQLQELEIKGKTALVNSVKKAAQRLRVFYLPFYVPISVITQQLIRLGIKVFCLTFGIFSSRPTYRSVYRTACDGHTTV